MKLRRFSIIRNREGAAAIEFSLLAMPFFLLVFGILDMALAFFVDGALDSALHMAARDVRTGRASAENWGLPKFKEEVCGGMAFAFHCEKNLRIATTVMNDLSSVSINAKVSNGILSVKEGFDNGSPSSYMMIQAFLPWPSLLAPFGVNAAHLEDGRYVLSATALFRNEPFEN